MKSIFDHIEHVKGKPHHIRKQVAFAAAACASALIALIWLVGNLSFGTFAIAPTSFADTTGAASAAATSGGTSADGLAGAAAALPAGGQGSEGANAPAHIQIVDTASSTNTKKQAEQTILPF